jgi:hypothetical protein
MPDALIAAQAGFRSVGLLGAHTPDEAVAARLANYAANLGTDIALVCDPDPAGRRVAETLVPLLEPHEIRPITVDLPDGLDLNAWALADADWSHDLYAQLCRPDDPALTNERAIGIEM